MALAYLKYKGQEDSHYVFHADTGTAKFFRYVLGEKSIKLRVGNSDTIRVVSGNKKASSLFKVNETLHSLRSSFPLKIPEHEVTEGIKYIQLYSFNDANNKAPTVSKILRLMPVRTHNSEFAGITLSLETQEKPIAKNYNTMQNIQLKNKALNYHEPPLSKVMFWNALVGALPSLLQQAAPILGSLLGNLNKGGNNNNNNNSQQSNDITNKVLEVLQTLTKLSNQNTEQSTTQSFKQLSRSYNILPETLLGLQPILEKTLTPEAVEAIGDSPQKLFLAIKDAVLVTESTTRKLGKVPVSKSSSKYSNSKSNFSKAKVAPALLAALPALMPVIEKALNPELIEAVGNQPVKLFKAIGDAVLKMDEQEIKHLEAINPGVDSANDISTLLQGMSVSHALYQEDLIKYNLIKDLNLNVLGTKTVFFKNKNRVLYAKNTRILLPFSITTDHGERLSKIIPRSVIQILIKDAETMKLVFRKTIKLVDIDLSKDIDEAFITEKESESIPCNTEFKLEISYIWKSKSGKNIGVLKNQYIHFIKNVVYDRIGERIGDTIPFNNINIHRKFWHKIWDGGYSNSLRWEVVFDVQYIMALNTKEAGIAKMETKTMQVSDNINEVTEYPKRRQIHARLKSGFELSFEAINQVLQILNQEPLDAELLYVLKRSDAKKSFSLSARYRAEMKGRAGDTSTLWTYPEFALRKLHVSKVESIDSYGQVISIMPQEHVIAMPEIIHFIGTKSEH
ncbi:hypothetical protein A8C32_01800 [Flavivirga aquatica]|uniref:Uncharacterized protein n=1 Tax=Flavivirga aquatica TaxID=1849968 RepID=A0A1E5TA18_9FLAO|nr:hypothetical protein [Flavivirga aquatica]OEK08222.1 hypothetical protein A8C32_01800 [Flavivirga aquatica]